MPVAPEQGKRLRERAWRVQFAELVAKGTGLEPAVVLAWTYVENAGQNNPLGLKPGGRLADYGSTEAAAKATVRNLLRPLYAPVIRAARTDDARAQIEAIAASPWVGPEDPNKGKRYRDMLLGRYRMVKDEGVQLSDVSDPVTNVVYAATGWAGDLTGWAENKAVTALAYLLLTGGALALIVLGLLRALGTGPRELAGMVASRRAAPAGGDIPF